MSQSFGLSSDIRDHTEDLHEEWIDVTSDGVVCENDMQRMSRMITALLPKAAHLDDSVRLATSLLKITVASPKIPGRVREHERLHGPVSFEQYVNSKKHRQDCNPTDAA